jgi:acetoacetyl-CoA synthetase
MTNNNILWQPGSEFIENSKLNHYCNWLKKEQGLSFTNYDELWKWSVNETEAFWESLWHYFEIKSYTPYNRVLSSFEMPGAKWFEGATLNYAEHLFRHASDNEIAIYFGNETAEISTLSWKDLKQKVASFASYLKSLGIKKGDRVVAFLPNIPEATIAFLAINSLGAIWSSTSPDFGVESVVDRFAQIEPRILIGVDGYRYNGKSYDKKDIVNEIVSKLPSLEKVILLPYLDKESMSSFSADFVDMNSVLNDNKAKLEFVPVDFDHPMWVLYSSGTTGLPKAIVQSHGGILMEHLKYMAFHNDVHQGEKFFWYSTTGWMMWNFVQAAFLMGASIVLYDGSPTYPDFNAMWAFSERVGINHFGTSAPFLVACMKRQTDPKSKNDLSAMRSLSSTGAPLPPEAFEWTYNHVKSDLWLCSMAGGTDVCTAFVGGNPFYPVHKGEIQCRALGVSLYAYNDEGDPVQDELGEMVIDKPMPSMPESFWNDEGNARYKASYFEDYPGKWRHGDFIRIDSKTHGLIIYGRSDATLNRHGIRIGTAEIYRAVDKISEVEDSLIINLELEHGKHYMPLFVKMKEGFDLDESIKQKINTQLKTEYTPRHVPDEIILVPDIPYTISGKKMEAPIKKILMKMPIHKSINFDSMRNPESVNFFIEFAEKWQV